MEIDSDGALINQEPDKKQKKKRKQNPNEPPSDLLLKERVNAKLLQFKLKRLGIAVSLWEIFSLFEYINMRLAKMAYEPQRYHFVMFEHLYTVMTSKDYKVEILGIGLEEEQDPKKAAKVKKQANVTKKDDADALSVAE